MGFFTGIYCVGGHRVVVVMDVIKFIVKWPSQVNQLFIESIHQENSQIKAFAGEFINFYLLIMLVSFHHTNCFSLYMLKLNHIKVPNSFLPNKLRVMYIYLKPILKLNWIPTVMKFVLKLFQFLFYNYKTYLILSIYFLNNTIHFPGKFIGMNIFKSNKIVIKILNVNGIRNTFYLWIFSIFY